MRPTLYLVCGKHNETYEHHGLFADVGCGACALERLNRKWKPKPDPKRKKYEEPWKSPVTGAPRPVSKEQLRGKWRNQGFDLELRHQTAFGQTDVNGWPDPDAWNYEIWGEGPS